ncbi:hypothetical protein ACWDA7_43515 [Streptomyces sp. NPDC001156]
MARESQTIWSRSRECAVCARLSTSASQLAWTGGTRSLEQGGWAPHSKVLAGYLVVVDQWEDNALLGVL